MKKVYKFLFISMCFLIFHNIAYGQQIQIIDPLPIGTRSKPIKVDSSFTITWEIDNDASRPGVVQVYLYGDLIFPQNPHEESLPGLTLKLSPGKTYEIKIWIPTTMINTSTWIFVREDKDKNKVIDLTNPVNRK